MPTYIVIIIFLLTSRPTGLQHHHRLNIWVLGQCLNGGTAVWGAVGKISGSTEHFQRYVLSPATPSLPFQRIWGLRIGVEGVWQRGSNILPEGSAKKFPCLMPASNSCQDLYQAVANMDRPLNLMARAFIVLPARQEEKYKFKALRLSLSA